MISHALAEAARAADNQIRTSVMLLRQRPLYLLLLLFTPILLPGQTRGDIDADADTLVRGADDMLFDSTVTDLGLPEAGDESTSLTEQRPSGWAPELPAFRFRRRDLLGLQDSPPFILSYDRADGLFLGLGGNSPLSFFREQRLQGYFGFGYSFGSHYWQVYGGVKKDFLTTEQPLRIGVEGHILTDTQDAWKMGRGENTVAALLAGVDTRDYFQRRGFSISAQQFISPRIAIKGEYRLDNYKNSQREAGWSLFGPKQPFREVAPIREGRMQSFVVNLLADCMALRSWDDGQLGVEAQAEFGSMGDDNFAQYVIDGVIKKSIVEKRFWLAARARVGLATAQAPPQKLFTIGGFGTLPGFPQNAWGGNRLLLLQSDLLFAPIPELGLRVILENNLGYTSTADSAAGIFEGLLPENISSLQYSPGLYLGTATGRVRIGFAFRTDIFADPVFVIRLAQPF